MTERYSATKSESYQSIYVHRFDSSLRFLVFDPSSSTPSKPEISQNSSMKTPIDLHNLWCVISDMSMSVSLDPT